jgi:hypothetical protein
MVSGRTLVVGNPNPKLQRGVLARRFRAGFGVE